jgi:hypothetical protein
VIDAKWNPSEKPLYRSLGVKHSAIKAPRGPHIMSCAINDSMIARITRPGFAVFINAK